MRTRTNLCDPNANLHEQLKLAKTIVDDKDTASEAKKLAELVLELNDWLVRGEERPQTWGTCENCEDYQFCRTYK